MVLQGNLFRNLAASLTSKYNIYNLYHNLHHDAIKFHNQIYDTERKLYFSRINKILYGSEHILI